MAENLPQITVKPNGPYVVSGGVPLRRKRPIVSEHGEPLTWQTDEVMDDGVAYALCRCGASANKPYCDGTHASDDFDGTEAAPTTQYAERRKTLGGINITIYDDRKICEHAGFCGNQVTNVWEMAAKTGDTVVRAEAMAMIERCPSGALAYEVEGVAVEPSLPQEIGVVDDGPLYVSGGIPVERADGEPLETLNRTTLCRCGQSAIKPLCDGTHKEVGFTDS